MKDKTQDTEGKELIHLFDIMGKDGQPIPCYGPADPEEQARLAAVANAPRLTLLLNGE